VVTDTYLVPKPRNISHVEAASIPLVTLTALQSFEKVKSGLKDKTVLVTAGRKYTRLTEALYTRLTNFVSLKLVGWGLSHAKWLKMHLMQPKLSLLCPRTRWGRWES
jgi:hypothetical protein